MISFVDLKIECWFDYCFQVDLRILFCLLFCQELSAGEFWSSNPYKRSHVRQFAARNQCNRSESGCIKHLKIKGTRNYYFKTISCCFRTKIKSPLILRKLYATWPRPLRKHNGQTEVSVCAVIGGFRSSAFVSFFAFADCLSSCYFEDRKSVV